MTADSGVEPAVEIFDDADEHAYVISVGDRPAGKAVYHLRGGRYFFVHTEIDPDMGGRGLGRQLARFALEDVKDKGGTVVPICPFFRSYIKRNPEWDAIVDHEILARIERTDDSG